MPFFDDTGANPEAERHPIWRSFALVRDQLERMVALNIAWAMQGVPLLVSWAFPQIPAELKILLALYSAFALVPATATLFAALNQTSDGIPLDVPLIGACLKEQFRPSLLKLLPLYSLFYWLALGAYFAAAGEVLILDVLARLAILVLAVFSIYWGPLLVSKPELSAWGVLLQSVQCFWRSPSQTLLIGFVCLLALLLGIISVAGLFLIVPVSIALFQIQLYRSIRSTSNVKG